MPNDGDRSVSVTSHHFVVEPPPQIDVRRSYGAISVDEFTKQHAIGYLGLPFEWDDDDQGWIVAVRAEHLKLMAQFLDDLEAMDYGEDIEIGEGDDLGGQPKGTLKVFAVRAYRGD